MNLGWNQLGSLDSAFATVLSSSFFDVETVFLYPWAVAFHSLGLLAFIEALVFIAIHCCALSTHGVKELWNDLTSNTEPQKERIINPIERPSITQELSDVILTTVDDLYNWSRLSSLWPLFGTACFMSLRLVPRFDDRFGHLFQPPPS